MLWTANEEALEKDGKAAGLERGSTVRIQRFDRDLAPAGQWAYVTEPIPGSSATGLSRNGVADLLVLPDGLLLVLERSLSDHGLGAQIFLVDFKGASDVSRLPSLAHESFVPVRKTLLWEMRGLAGSFEGITLGPELHDGDLSLILISDDAGILAPTLYALRVGTRPGRTAAH